jgi:hypothetical protein
MFFTPGRILGLVAFVVIMIVIAFLLQRLDRMIGSPVGSAAEPTSPDTALPAEKPAPLKAGSGGRRKRRHG